MEPKQIILCVLISIFVLFVVRIILESIKSKTNKETKLRNVLEIEFPKLLNVENQQVNIENWASIDSPEAQIIHKMIKGTHNKCPVMSDHKPNVSVCIQDPKTNQGYIVSLCCGHCLEKIQESLKLNDNKFSIRKLNHVDILYYHNEPKQIAVPCNRINLEKVMKLMGTKLL